MIIKRDAAFGAMFEFYSTSEMAYAASVEFSIRPFWFVIFVDANKRARCPSLPISARFRFITFGFSLDDGGDLVKFGFDIFVARINDGTCFFLRPRGNQAIPVLYSRLLLSLSVAAKIVRPNNGHAL